MLRFGGFGFDPATLQLTGGGLAAPLTGLPCRILHLLLLARGGVVTRVELKARLWPGCERIDTERRLNTAMRALREALGETSADPVYVATVRGVGYRWVYRPAARRPLARLAAAAALMALAALGSLAPANTPDPQASSQFVALAAEAGASPQAAAPRLQAFLRQRPHYAPAALLYADTAATLWRSEPTPARLAEARSAIAAAQRLVGHAPRLILLAADLDMRGDWNFRAAEQAYRRLLARDPTDVEAHRALGWLYLNTARPALARAEVDRALTGGPLTVASRADLGWLLIRLRRPDLAAALCQADAASLNLLSCRQTALADLGQWAPARDAALTIMRRLDAPSADLAAVEAGPPDAGHARFLQWRAAAFTQGHGHWFQRAQLRASAGDYPAALDALDQALAARDPDLVKLATSREFEPLQRDPRFQTIRQALERAWAAHA